MRVAFLGLGMMGSGMAGRLLAAGHQVSVFNRTASKAAPLVAAGARLASSGRILHFGTVGTGTAYKLIINMMGAVQIASAAEGMALAQRAGLNLNTVVEAVSSGQAASPQVVRNVRRMADADHDSNIVFTAALRLKDVEYALRLVHGLQMAAPFGQLAAQGLVELCNHGRAQANESSIFEVALKRARA